MGGPSTDGGSWLVPFYNARNRVLVDPVRALEDLAGAGSWSQLMSAGVSDARLRGAVRRGDVLRVAVGTYALPSAEEDVAAAVRARGRLTCVSVARRWGLELLREPDRPHVAVARNRSRGAGDVVRHRVDSLEAGVFVPLLPALVTLLRCLPLVEAVVVVDCALRKRLVRASQLHARLRGPGSVRARTALMAADGRSGSGIESVVRLALIRAGLRPVPQAWIAGVGRVDFLIDGWLVVEIDGFAFHSERRQYREDRRRANALAAAGYTLLRFTYEEVRGDVAGVVAAVLAVRDQRA